MEWLWGLTLVGLLARWYFAVGFLLGDDISYVELVRDAINGYYMTIEAVGQYAYRPMWIYPIAAAIKLFGWDPHILVLYPMITGGLIPVLTALWIRRHLPVGSKAPLLCAVILQCYPTMFVDSLVLANEIPMIFWALLCVNLFGMAYAHLAQSTEFWSRPLRLFSLSLLSGLAFGASYQVKASAIPVLGLWLLGELILQLRRHGRPKAGPFALAAVGFALPVLAIQTFYLSKTGSLMGNFRGEIRLYELWLPREYFQGTFDNVGTLMAYVHQLLSPYGYEGYMSLLHGPWVWIALGLILIAGFIWRQLPREHRAVGGMLLLVTTGLFLFMEFWPARMDPYYIPNCFSGRPWRYIDVLAPTVAAWVAVILMPPRRMNRGVFQAVRVLALAGGFGIAGYCMVLRIFEFADRSMEFRQVYETKEILKPYLNVPHYIDADGSGHLQAFLGMPRKPVIIGRSSGTEEITLDLRQHEGACVWTGGARRYGVNADDAYSPEKIRVIGGELRLVHTWLSTDRPWRLHPLQLWAYHPAPQENHEAPKSP